MAASDFLELSFANKEKSLTVRRFRVREALSSLFEVSIVARSPNPDIDLEGIVGKAAGVKLRTGLQHAMISRYWTGVCNYIEQIQAEVSDKGESTYLVKIVPDLWLLSQRTGHRIFQRKTLPEIVKAVLDEWKIKPNLRLNKKYQKHDYVVQYGESDYAFLCRLLERAGITFFFTFDEDKVSELTLSDEPERGKKRPGPAIHAVDQPNAEAELEYVTRVHVAQVVKPGNFTLREYDFRKKADYPFFSKTKPAEMPEGFFEQYHYAPGESLRVDPPDGSGAGTPTADDKGKVRTSQQELDGTATRGLASVRGGRREVAFHTNCVDLTPGLLFSIDKHARSDLKPAEKLLVHDFFLEGVVGEKWTFGGRAVYASEPWVPAAVTPRPKIAGVQSAIVVGPKGEDIYTDEFGRVRVQFHWDREGKFDENSSAWIRVSQEWAGAGYGSELIPRVGHEVLVGFLEGDPDQPVVVGRVYSIMNRVPHKLPDEKTRSTWKSNSTPYSNGFSEIMFEDKKDKELFYVQAERDLQKLVKREEIERTFEDRMIVVGQNRSTVVKTVDATLAGERYVQQMIDPPSEYDLKILKQELPVVKPRPTTVEMVSGRVIFTTGEATFALDGGSIALEAKGNITVKARGGDAILEGTMTFINTMSPGPAPKPKAIGKIEPGTFVSRFGDKRDILNKYQAARFELKYQALSSSDKRRFDKLLANAKSDAERDYIKKALAAGHPVSEVEPFADRIRGSSSEWQQDNLSLTMDSKGKGVQQQFGHSCNATMVQAVHGELDPIYALKVHDQNPNFASVNDANALAANPSLAAEQQAMLQANYTGALGPMNGGVAVDRANPNGAGRWADDHLNAMSSTTGVTYTPQLNANNPGPSLAAIDAGLEQGAPVPIVVGGNTANNAYGHYAVVTGSLDGPPKSYIIHDPWTGDTITQPASALQNNTANVAGWSQLNAVEVPTVVSGP